MLKHAVQGQLTEWVFQSGRPYADSFNEVEFDMRITTPSGREQLVPGFWNGDQTWCVRYASLECGLHHYETVCTDRANPDLHGRGGELEVHPYEGTQTLFRHGPIRVPVGGRTLEHADGTPFFWLADTWWDGLTTRLGWPGEFRMLLRDRVAKGFSVVQIVAGLLPDGPGLEPGTANEGGVPWEQEYRRPNPAYWDHADDRVGALVQAGVVPCIVGAWGFHVEEMGVERMKRHWRYILGRWGAYPVVWCLCGEVLMPLHGTYDRGGRMNVTEVAERRQRWSEVARYLRQIDPYQRPVTVHPFGGPPEDGLGQLDDDALTDFTMLQTGHDPESVRNHVQRTMEAVARGPGKPVLVGECMYESIIGRVWQDLVRFAFWSAMLSGTAGHSYGANGVWQFATSPTSPVLGMGNWGGLTWEEAYELPGAAQVGLGRRLLERFAWWEFCPRPKWVMPAASAERHGLFAAGIDRRVRIVYVPAAGLRPGGPYRVRAIESGVKYAASWFDPRRGTEESAGSVVPDENGEWSILLPRGDREDWVLVLTV